MTSMIKQQWRNASSTIFRIASASILLELPSNFFGKSCYSDSSPLLSLVSHFKQDFEWRNILITPLDTPIMIKEFPLEQSYLLPDDLFCHPISYVTVSLTLLLFLPCLIEHTSHHMTDFFVLVCVLFPTEEPLQSPNISPAVRPCLHVLQFL